MSAAAIERARERLTPSMLLSRGALPLLVLLLLATGMVSVIDGSGISLPLALAAGVTLIGFVLLVLERYDMAVAIGFLLMGIVRFEPAPPDGAFAVIIAVATVTGRFRLDRTPLLARALIAVLIAINVLSMVDSIELTVAFRFFFITAYLAIFALWMTSWLTSRGRARIVVVTWVAIAVVSAVVSTLMLELPLPGRDFILMGDNELRARGFFKDPNVYGPFLIPIAVILLEYRIAPRLKPVLKMRGWLVWLAFAALALGVIFSYSRAAWANFAIAVAVTLLASSLRRSGAQRAIRAMVMLVVVAGIALMVLQASGSLAFLEERAQLQSYDTERFTAQHVGYELGWSHPVGIGPGQFQFRHNVETHSTYVRVFAEQGFIGVLTWIAILLSTLVLALRNVVAGRDTYGIGSSALLGAWCGLIFNSIVVDTLHWRHLWVVAALIWAGSMRSVLAERQRALD